jgi:hypothetical protein
MLFWHGRFRLAALGDNTRADLGAGEGRARFTPSSTFFLAEPAASSR